MDEANLFDQNLNGEGGKEGGREGGKEGGRENEANDDETRTCTRRTHEKKKKKPAGESRRSQPEGGGQPGTDSGGRRQICRASRLAPAPKSLSRSRSLQLSAGHTCSAYCSGRPRRSSRAAGIAWMSRRPGKRREEAAGALRRRLLSPSKENPAPLLDAAAPDRLAPGRSPCSRRRPGVIELSWKVEAWRSNPRRRRRRRRLGRCPALARASRSSRVPAIPPVTSRPSPLACSPLFIKPL